MVDLLDMVYQHMNYLSLKIKKTVRTFNFNSDVNAADTVLKSDKNHIKNIILIGKKCLS